MLTKSEFNALLDARQTLVLDGALATELEFRGHDLNHALWSAKVLRDDPDSIKAVHLDYFLAGADIAITSSYQGSTQGLTDHFGLSEDEGKALIRRSVEVAHLARGEAYERGVNADRNLLIAGSVGPFGAYLADGSEYRGDYVRTPKEFKDFHRPRIEALISGGVDLLALETIPSISEIRALLELLCEEFPSAIGWLSCTILDANSLCDKTPWRDVVETVNDLDHPIIGIGINCVPMAIATDALNSLHALTKLPLVCVSRSWRGVGNWFIYPNSGEEYDAVTKTWHGQRPEDTFGGRSTKKNNPGMTTECRDWTSYGAKLIGGCCRTGPAFVKAVDQALGHQHRP